ncbi:MAG: hypothetical protein JWO15_2619, partial [Sphingomonadales bacterium]|nr:hypothetical protein [Sphingomonadales bacterium]
ITRRWLTEHVSGLEAPDRYASSVLIWERFYEHLRELGRMPEPYTVARIKPAFVREFIKYRENAGISAPSISRDLKALRGPINWAMREGYLSAAPFVPDVKGKSKRRELEWSPEQIAAILEAAASTPLRAHVLLYMMIFLSTNGRSQAILELDADKQIRKGLIYFNAPGREQTRKKRSIVPIAPTLAPWLEGLEGKVIRYRAPTTQKTRDAGGPDYFERPTSDLGNSFKACLVEAGEKHPEFGFSEHVEDADGNLVWLPPRAKIGETKVRPLMKAIGSPNTLRHSIHTFLAARGVPKAQIDTAAGHATDDGTGDRYNHLRPAYLTDFIAGIEAFWTEVSKHTNVHLLYQNSTKIAEKSASSFNIQSSLSQQVAEISYQPSEDDGAPDRIRTCDPCLRRAVLYPAELRVRRGRA